MNTDNTTRLHNELDRVNAKLRKAHEVIGLLRSALEESWSPHSTDLSYAAMLESPKVHVWRPGTYASVRTLVEAAMRAAQDFKES